MSNNNYLLTREGNFITVSDDELYHWKYIKREKVNGKWRYYYHDDDVGEAKEAYEKAKATSDSAAKARDALIARTNRRLRQLNDEHSAKYKTAEEQDAHWPEFFDNSKPLIEAVNRAKGRATESQKVTDDAELNYKAAKRKYDESAGHKVADLLNKSSDAVDKAKSWVSNLLKKKK